MKKLIMLVVLALFGLSFVGVAAVMANDQCFPVGVGTPGYWKNHPEAWPVDAITVGGQVFTKEQAIGIMSLSVRKDKSLTMFKAYVAAKLNVLIGNCPPEGCYTLAEVNDWLTWFPVLSGVPAKSEAWQYSHGEALYWCLDDYNNGRLNMPSRD